MPTWLRLSDHFVSAGIYTDTIGQIGNGNEKGITTARDSTSGVVYSGLDFGDYGSDEITMPVFALDSAPHKMEFWLGKPGEEESELLVEAIYQKPSVWNVYQEATWKLPRRIKGIATFAINMYEKVHVKGFIFRKLEKAYCRIDAAECSNIYGDRFQIEQKAVNHIGNNVTIEYENMDFGVRGANSLTIWGRSALAQNTIHLLFEEENGLVSKRILELKGSSQYEEQSIDIEPITGKGKVQFVFLPGSDYDLESFQFEKR